MVRVNFADVSDAFEPVPSGVYTLRIDEAEVKEAGESAKHPGSQYIAWTLKIEGGDFEGQNVWTNTVVDHGECDCSEEDTFNKGLFQLKGLYKATGKFTEKDLNSASFEIDPNDIIGEVVRARVIRKGREEDEYGVQNQIKKFMVAGESVAAPGLQ